MKDKWDLRFKNLAMEVGEWSKDPSTKVGCIAVKDRKVIATGYNGFPVNISDSQDDYENREIKLKKTIMATKTSKTTSKSKTPPSKSKTPSKTSSSSSSSSSSSRKSKARCNKC